MITEEDKDKLIATLTLQLQEKEEEYQAFKKITDENVNYLKNRILEETRNYNQDKIELLEKVKCIVNSVYREPSLTRFAIINSIDTLISNIKGE